MSSAIKEQEFDKKVDLNIWKRLLKYAFRYPKLVIGLIGVLLLVAAVDLIYPLLTKYAIDNFITKGDIGGLPAFALIYLGFVAIQGLGVFLFVSGGRQA